MSHLSTSVVICAYTEDRWADIVAAVAGCHAQTHPPDELLLIADHNSALAARARAEFVGVAVLDNRLTRGLSGARNTAIAAARGDVVVFLDDDATPESDWLATLLAPYADPQVLAVGGSAAPVWPDRRPAHLPHELDWVIGCTYGGQPEERAEVRNLMGCNMSFRREVFAEIGGFDETSGRVGSIPVGCEETELCIRLRQRRPDARIVFEPASRVRHRVTEARTRWAYLRSRSFAEGRSKAAISTLVGADDATSAERTYVRTVLPGAIRRELRRGRDGRVGSAGILVALGATTAGFVSGRLGFGGRLRRQLERARG